MARPEVLDVKVERPCGPLRGWEDALSAHVGRVDPALREQEATLCFSLDERRFAGRIEHGELGETLLARVSATACRFSRSLTMPSPTLPTPAMLVLLSKGSCRFAQRGRSCVLSSGDWTLIDTKEAHEYTVSSAEMEVFALMLPRPSDAQICSLFERGVARRWSSRVGLSRVMQAMVSESFGEMRRLPRFSGRKLGAAITGMAWDALREQIETPPVTGQRDERTTRVKSYVEARLADPELSVESIAHACNVSVRGLHRLFADEPAGSVSNYLWQLRLTRCAEVLRDPAQADRSITEICFSYGFSSSSHFSRLFKNRFGLPPARYRAGP